MHPQANRVIRSVFEYFKFKSPSWKKPHEKIFTLCFDEMHLDNLADLDKTLDMVIGPAKNGNILMVGSHTFRVLVACLFKFLIISNDKCNIQHMAVQGFVSTTVNMEVLHLQSISNI